MRVTALIVDDEPIARRTLRRLLDDVPWVECLGEAADGVTAVRLIDGATPDVVFLDVQMPGMSGLEVLNRVTHHPHLVFTTAFDQYAVTAFELRALDYLLKPFGRRRLHEALERVSQAVAQSRSSSSLDRARDALANSSPLTCIYVREGGAIVSISTDTIERLEARGDYVGVWVQGRRHLVHLPLRDVERSLDPARFVRIHRSHIINLDHVARVTPDSNGRLRVEMRDGTAVTSSRARTSGLRKLLRCSFS